MEEAIGKIWHRWITKASTSSFPEKAAYFSAEKEKLAIQLRAIVQDKGIELKPSQQLSWNSKTSWLSKIARSQEKVQIASFDAESIQLPSQLAYFDNKTLNQKLYLWLILLCSVGYKGSIEKEDDENIQRRNWLEINQFNTLKVFEQFPTAKLLYFRLANAYVSLLTNRLNTTNIDFRNEGYVQQALLNPGSIKIAIEDPATIEVVPLWLYPKLAYFEKEKVNYDIDSNENKELESATRIKETHRRKGEYVDESDGRDGLLAFRLESLFSWSEFSNVDRTADDGNEDDAEATADDLDVLSVSKTPNNLKSRLKFDLDLPAISQDDNVILKGILLPEWNYKKSEYRTDYCALQVMSPKDALPCPPPKHLRLQIKTLKSHFESLTLNKIWLKKQLEGSELDLDSVIQNCIDRRQNYRLTSERFYQELQLKTRDTSCLLLADLSLSTDAWVNDEAQVIDVIRDSLFLFTEALETTSDSYAVCGFSSVKRNHNRFYQLKKFSENLSDDVRGRIGAIRPGYYTRMGAAIRHAASLLNQQKSSQKLLILMTDGKPNDIDCYEGRYGIEDTRKAIQEVKNSGLIPFCITIDETANQYLPYIFGQHNFVLVKRAVDLPRKLLKLYKNLTM